MLKRPICYFVFVSMHIDIKKKTHEMRVGDMTFIRDYVYAHSFAWSDSKRKKKHNFALKRRRKKNVIEKNYHFHCDMPKTIYSS